jgi:hypothetical protein
MFEINHLHAGAALLADGLATLFALASLLHLTGFRRLRNAYRRGRYPRSSVNAVGVVLGLAALFLGVPSLRIWGAILAGLILFAVVTSLLNHQRYFWAVSMMVLLAALVPALA